MFNPYNTNPKISSESIDKLAEKIEYLCLAFERAVIVAEAKTYYKIGFAEVNLVDQAITSPSTNAYYNYTTLTCIGETTLKLLHVLTIMHSQDQWNESTATSQKGEILSSDILSS